MNRKVTYILILLLVVIVHDSSAQNSQVLYHMNLPQNYLLNPGIRPTSLLYIGLPALSGVNLNINNNFVNFSDVFINNPTDTTVITILHPDYDITEFLPKIKDINSIESGVLVQLLGLGFNVGKDLYIFLDINERVDANVLLPGDLLRLGFEGNEQFVGSRIDLSSLRGDVKYYREAGLGFSKNFTDRLRIGVKGKVLFGITSASIDNKSLGLTVNDDYSHTVDADLTVNLSAPVNVYINAENNIDSIKIDTSRFDGTKNFINYFLETQNMGLGLDIGAEFRFSDNLKISAAITDLGYIKWKKDISNLEAESQFNFSGYDLQDVYDEKMTFDSLSKELIDSLKNSFILTDTKTPFTTYLPFGVSVGGSYNLTKNLSLGLLSYTRITGKQVREALTVSANLNFGNLFSTSIAYTMANKTYDNMGFGLAFRAGMFQIYAIADRIPMTWDKVILSKAKIPIPENWKTFNARIGLNLTFGNMVLSKNDKPMILVQ